MTETDTIEFLELFGSLDDILGEYVTHIANGGLRRYRRYVQWGGKKGQPLYTHVIDLVFTLNRLTDLLDLTPIEQRVLMLALSVHDLNKVPEYQHFGSYNALATPENVAAELQSIDADDFFPEWRTYLQDVVTLMRAHSDHAHVGGEMFPLGGDYRLGQERVEELAELVKGLDVIDLSHDLSEQRHKRTFLSHLNYLSNVQYEFVYHTVAEQRGILSNVMHNRIAEYMQRSKGALPLLYYPEGVAYLVPRGLTLEFTDDDYDAIGTDVAEFIENQTRGNIQNFIKPTNQGIKIAAKCLELSMPFATIWQEVHNIIQGKTYRAVENMEKRARERAEQSIAEDDSAAAKAVRQHLERPELIPHQDRLLQLGELVRSYYIFLSTHFKKEVPDAWNRLYTLLDIPSENQEIYGYFNLNYDRSYVLAADLPLTYEQAIERIVPDGKELLSSRKQENVWQPIFQEYVQLNVQFSFQPFEQATFAGSLRRYVQDNHKQSAYGSTIFETELWRSGDVPRTVKVQQFSNRLAGGPGDPVKRIDPVTKAQFLLEKLNYPPAYKATTYYLHIYPYAFFSHDYIKQWQRTVRDLAERDVSALFIKTDDVLRSIFDENSTVRLSVSPSSSNGLPLPGAPEMLGNVLIWPLNAPGKNDTEQFWYAFTATFAMHRFIGGRVVLTRSAVPVVGPNEFGDLFIDEIPLSLQGFLRQNNFNYEEIRSTKQNGKEHELERSLEALYELYRQVYNPSTKVSEEIALARSLNDGPLGIYHASERLLMQRIRDAKNIKSAEWVLIRSAGDMIDSLTYLATYYGGNAMIETIQELARLAVEGNLKGKSNEKNSLMTPLDECFNKLQQQAPPLDDDTLRAAAAQDIYEYLKRIRPRGMTGPTTRRKVSAFVNAFFTDLLKEEYKGNLQRLLTDEKLIRSAFLFHVWALRDARSSKKEAAEAKDTALVA